eukprot:12923711-Prorocentrum_lima.AAC.1
MATTRTMCACFLFRLASDETWDHSLTQFSSQVLMARAASALGVVNASLRERDLATAAGDTAV